MEGYRFDQKVMFFGGPLDGRIIQTSGPFKGDAIRPRIVSREIREEGERGAYRHAPGHATNDCPLDCEPYLWEADQKPPLAEIGKALALVAAILDGDESQGLKGCMDLVDGHGDVTLVYAIVSGCWSAAKIAEESMRFGWSNEQVKRAIAARDVLIAARSAAL